MESPPSPASLPQGPTPDGPRTAAGRAWISWGLRGVVTFALCGFLIRHFDLSAVRPILAGLDPRWGLAALLCVLLANLTYALAAGPLLRRAGIAISGSGLVRNHFLGQFFSLFLPTAVGGDVARVVHLSRGAQAASLPAAGAMILTQRLLALEVALAAVIAAMACASAWEPTGIVAALDWRTAWISGGVLGGMFLLSLAMALLPSPAGRIPGLPERVSTPLFQAWGYGRQLLTTRGGGGALLRAAGWLALSVGFFVAATWMIGRGLGVACAPIHYVYVVPLASVAVTAPVSVNGIGVREAVYIHYLGKIGVTPAEAAAVSIALFVASTLFGALGWLAWVVPPAEAATDPPPSSSASPETAPPDHPASLSAGAPAKVPVASSAPPLA